MLAQILISNSFCYLRGFSPSELAFLKDSLTYTNQETYLEAQRIEQRAKIARYRGQGRAYAYLMKQAKDLYAQVEVCLLKDNAFPTGLLMLVCEIIVEKSWEVDILDCREPPRKTLHKLPWIEQGFSERPYQKAIHEAAVAAGRGVIESAVGSGKTLMMQKLIKEFAVPTLVIVPATDLRVQTFDAFVKTFSPKFVEQVTTKNSQKKLKPIRIVTVQTLAALQKKGELANVLEGVAMLLIDEIHHAGSASYTNLLPELEHIYYRFGFSGSFLRNDSKTLDMWGVLSDVLYKYPAHQAIEEGYLTPLKVVIHDIEGRRSQNYQKEYNGNYCGNVALLEKIVEIIDSCEKEDAKILILVKQKEKSGQIIFEYLENLGVDCVFISGNDKKEKIKTVLKDFNDGKIKVLIGSSIIGEGIDVKSTDHLIMAQGGKSEIAITQATGRAVRLYPGKQVAFIHDFNFEGTKYLEAHLTERLKIYEKNFGAKIDRYFD